MISKKSQRIDNVMLAPNNPENPMTLFFKITKIGKIIKKFKRQFLKLILNNNLIIIFNII